MPHKDPEARRAYRQAVRSTPKGRAARKAEYQRSKDRYAQARRDRYAANREAIVAQVAAYRATNRDAINLRRREIRAEDPGRFRAIEHVAYYAKRARRIWHTARARARREGVEFSIDASDVVIPETCPVFGTPFDMRDNVDMRGPRYDVPSLDRIDPSKGYVPGNVWVISFAANRIKCDSTPEELLMVAIAVAQKTGLLP
jgi:hypothetical protein